MHCSLRNFISLPNRILCGHPVHIRVRARVTTQSHGQVLPAWQGIKVLKTVWRPCAACPHPHLLAWVRPPQQSRVCDISTNSAFGDNRESPRLSDGLEWRGVEPSFRFRDCDAARMKNRLSALQFEWQNEGGRDARDAFKDRILMIAVMARGE